jgi:hypothetical protein
MTLLDPQRRFGREIVRGFKRLIVVAWGLLVGGALVANYVPGLVFVGAGIVLIGLVLQVIAAVLVIRYTPGPPSHLDEPYPRF